MSLLTMKDFLSSREKNNVTWPTKGMLYFWSHNNHKDFNKKCVKRMGRKIFIDTIAFEKWMLSGLE